MAKKYYYGTRQVVEVIDSPVDDIDVGKNRDNVKLLFKDGTSEVIRKRMVNYALTPEPLKNDLTELRENRCKPVIVGILEVLLDWDILPNDPMNELEYVLSSIDRSFAANIRTAIENVWGIKNETLRFSDIDKALRQKNEDTKST